MRILGIDPGSRVTGYGVIEKRGNRLIHCDNGAIHTDRSPDFPGRLLAIFRGVEEVIDRYAPDVVAIEEVFFSRNVQIALKLGQARGAAIAAAAHRGLLVFEYTPMQIKSAVVGYGHARKEQVQRMVKTLLSLPEIAQEDASDALAAAICHAHSHRLLADKTGVVAG